MRPRATLTPALIILLASATALLPAASAHAAPNPLSNEVHLIHDEGEDAFYWYDGYDLYNLHAREAYWDPAEAEGVIFRLDLYGGFAPQPTVDALHIEIGTGAGGDDGNSTALRMTTTNDRNWTGDLTIVALNITEDAPPWTGVTARMQLFATYAQLGVEKGASLDGVWMKSYAGDAVVDEAPGGFYLPGSNGGGEVPAESERLVDSLPLDGPTGYTETATGVHQGAITFTVKNALEATGQHVAVRLATAQGWTAAVEGATAASVDAGGSVTFTVNATAAPEATAPLAVDLITDLGGRETWHVGVNGTTLEVAPSADDVAVNAKVESGEETPLAPWAPWVALGLAGALVAGRRRR